MTAKDGLRNRPHRNRWLGLPAVCLAAASLAGCRGSYWNTERPSVEQLMVDAIDESFVHRQQQELIVRERDWHAAAAEASPDAADFVGGESEVVAAIHEEAPKPEDATLGELVSPEAERVFAAPETLPPPVREEQPVRISEEFFETELREAITILAEEAGADVILEEQVGGVVNTTIRDATFEQALDKLLLPLGFVYGRKGDQYVICEPDPKSPLFPYVSTHIEYRPRHLNAKDLLAAPPAQMKQFVRSVDEAGLLIIEAPTQFADLILQRIRSLDQPTPQVELEAIVCVVEPDSGFRFGLDWDHAVQVGGETAFKAGISGLQLSGQVSGQGLREVFSDFATTSAFVRLLADNGYLSIRASPRVMAQTGKKANIKIGRQTFFAVQPGGANNNSAVFFQQEIREVEAGIELEITPHIHEDDVTVQIAKAEVSEEVSPSATELANNAFPTINRRSVSTTVHVEDGKTIIIGGLVQREAIDRVNRVPGLSRLPGVGYLFKSIEHQEREAEVVIFISPRIVRPTGGPSGCEPELFNPTTPFPP